MFTGLVEAIGLINKRNEERGLLRLEVQVQNRQQFVAALGDSIAINGCCLTVATIEGNATFSFDVSRETLEKTNLGQLDVGSFVNLERAMRLGDRLGGHLVSGHIDGLADVRVVDPRNDGWYVQVAIPRDLARYIIAKGSICLDGVSLTINELVDEAKTSTISLTLIPTTIQETTLQHLKSGQKLNVEVDMMGKYIERFRQF